MEICQINMCNMSASGFGQVLFLCRLYIRNLTKFVVRYKIYYVILYTNIMHGYPLLAKVLRKGSTLIEGYFTIKEIAEKWGVTRRRVQTLCSQGRIPGATRFGHEWAIPADVERPTDGRITTGEYRNWRKREEKND